MNDRDRPSVAGGQRRRREVRRCTGGCLGQLETGSLHGWMLGRSKLRRRTIGAPSDGSRASLFQAISRPRSERKSQRKYYRNSHTTAACHVDRCTVGARVALTPLSRAVKFRPANEMLIYRGSAEPLCISLVTFVRLRA